MQIIAKEIGLTKKETTALVDGFFDIVSRNLADGEMVSVEGLGKFYTEEVPAQKIEDPPGSGHIVTTMPSIEVMFDPDHALQKVVDLQKIEEPIPVLKAPEPEKEPEKLEKAQEKEEELEGVKIFNPTKEMPLGRESHIEYEDISNRKIEKDVLSLMPLKLAKEFGAVPIELKEGTLKVAMIDPEDFDALQEIRKQTRLTIQPIITTREDLNSVLDQYTGLQAEVQEVISKSDFDISNKEIEEATLEDIYSDASEDSPTVRIVHSLLRRAVTEGASDIHIEPYEEKVLVRFRIDGILQAKLELPKEIQSAIVSRLKILANLKIDEQRLPQDGRFSIGVDDRQIDFRFSTIPVVFGEKIVMRILDKSVGIISLEEVGLADRGLEVLKRNMQRSHGMILVTGPTGSGKTTSLYAVLGKLMDTTVNIITLEDPVEYRIESINQSQVHTEIGYGFASGLRAIVRQDPDVVMLGEIRDQETADMAIHAALTGHVVLSTLHTNDAAGAFPRLIDMQIEPFLITSSLHTVIAQRLVRKICDNCKVEMPIAPELKKELEEEIEKMPEKIRKEVKKMDFKLYEGKGCNHCAGKGFKGRLGVFEVLDVTEDIRNLVLKRSSGADITAKAIDEGMVTMVQDGVIKALRGITTISEVWRVTKE